MLALIRSWSVLAPRPVRIHERTLIQAPVIVALLRMLIGERRKFSSVLLWAEPTGFAPADNLDGRSSVFCKHIDNAPGIGIGIGIVFFDFHSDPDPELPCWNRLSGLTLNPESQVKSRKECPDL